MLCLHAQEAGAAVSSDAAQTLQRGPARRSLLASPCALSACFLMDQSGSMDTAQWTQVSVAVTGTWTCAYDDAPAFTWMVQQTHLPERMMPSTVQVRSFAASSASVLAGRSKGASV